MFWCAHRSKLDAGKRFLFVTPAAYIGIAVGTDVYESDNGVNPLFSLFNATHTDYKGTTVLFRRWRVPTRACAPT